MNVDKFRESFQRLREKWNLDIEFERDVWRQTKNLTEKDFDSICLKLVEREFPPNLGSFNLPLPSHDLDLDRDRTPTPTPTVEEYKYMPCRLCVSGVVFAEHKKTKNLNLFKCTCTLSERVRETLPTWNHKLTDEFLVKS